MDNLLFTSFMVFLISMLPVLTSMVGFDNVGRPIVVGAMIGALLGDLSTGIMCGATIELIWLGVFAIGASNPPDMLSGAVIGTAYVILSGSPVESAVLLAVPVATMVKLVNEFRWSVINVVISGRADKYAEQADGKNIEKMYYISLAFGLVLKPLIVAVSFYFGIPFIERIVAAIPDFLVDGLMYATGIIPAIGFALIARMIMTKKTVLFLCLGFALASFFNLSVIGIASLGCILVAYLAFNDNKKEEAIDDNEF